MIPIDEAAARLDQSQGKHNHIIRGNFDAFHSPIDGSLINSHRSYENHNKRNGVVSSAEYSPEYYAGKAKEREDFFAGKRSRAEKQARKEEIYERWVEAERN